MLIKKNLPFRAAARPCCGKLTVLLNILINQLSTANKFDIISPWIHQEKYSFPETFMERDKALVRVEKYKEQESRKRVLAHFLGDPVEHKTGYFLGLVPRKLEAYKKSLTSKFQRNFFPEYQLGWFIENERPKISKKIDS